MPNYLLIVESPAKAKTIKKYLGPKFEVLASYGHIRDLVPKEGAVDPANDFAMKYALIAKNSKYVDHILQALKKSDALYLATDPDREGEAISWHLCEILQAKGALAEKEIHRVAFHELTKSAILEAIDNPRTIAMDLVNAQQARRALDYLVGFNLSPLLWKKIRKGLSAGRVQSPALRLIVNREEEIERFVAQEYWTIAAQCGEPDDAFAAKLHLLRGEKISQFSIPNEEAALAAKNHLLAVAKGQLQVLDVQKKQRKRQSTAPFITSTLQQEAVKRLGFTTQRTMRVAQQLYEGVDVGEGAVGLISYMRTDSVQLSQEALQDIRTFIADQYGDRFLPAQPRVFKTKSKNAQEAHEAIRPTSVFRTPAQIRGSLTDEQFKLYQLIWQRAVASQMSEALFDTVTVLLGAGSEQDIFKATGSTLVFPGFLSVYKDIKEDQAKEDEDGSLLPPLSKGDVIRCRDIQADQHFTEPPPRYGEAALIKALEEYGIGRPATYTTIIATLLNREYVILEQKKFKPTDMGRVVAHFLTRYFTQYVDYDFTAHLEDELDAIARGERDWHQILHHFWSPFKELVQNIGETVSRKDVTREPLDENCPKCGKILMLQLGRRSRFIGCSGYPDCDYTRAAHGDTEPDPVITDRPCPDCGGVLKIKNGPYSKFIGCSNYPKCKHIESLEKPKDLGVMCPECHEGHFLQRKSKRGKIFYSCSRYPHCKYATWDPPVEKPCPKCQWPILTVKTTKKNGERLVCPQKSCGFQSEPTETSEDVTN